MRDLTQEENKIVDDMFKKCKKSDLKKTVVGDLTVMLC